MPDMKEKAERGLAVFLSGYAKRMLGPQFDKLMETEFGRKLQGLDNKYRYGIEVGLHALGTVIEQVLPEDKPAVMFFKQVLEDAPAEVAERLIYGVRCKLLTAAQNAKTQEERMAIMSLLELDDESLKEMLRWFGSMDSSERTRAEGVVCNLAFNDLQRMARLSPEERKVLVDIQNPPPASKPPPKESEALVKEVLSDMQIGRQSLQQKRNELRDKRRAKFHGKAR